MKIFWLFLFMCLPIIGLGYIALRTYQILPLPAAAKWSVIAIMILCFVIFLMNFISGYDRFPMTLAECLYEVGNSSLFILLYLVMIFLVLDLGRLVHIVPPTLLHNSIKGSVGIFATMIVLFTYGYFNYLHKVRQPLELSTTKTVHQSLKIVMISDLHLGYHNRIDEFNKWVDKMNHEHPDLILIGGDIIDGSIRAVTEQPFAEAFHRLQAPVYACLGNHEYYSGEPRARKFYDKAGIHLLIDSVATVKGINIIGRDDRTNPDRASVKQLKDKLHAPELFTIMLDHQPYHLEEAEQAGIDFQFSGHTHYGQMWPVSWIEDMMYEDAFGPLQKGNTQYYVSSGIGIWGAKFRIGTRSEYIVATLKKN